MSATSKRKQKAPTWLEELTYSFAKASVAERLIVGFLAVAAVVGSILGAPGIVGILGAGLALIMLTIAAIDRRRYIIPNALTATSLGLGLVHAAALEPDAILAAVAFAAGRGIAIAGIFLLVRYGYSYLRGREGLGLGDVKLAAVAGVWLDWSILPIAVEIAAFTAISAYVVRQFSSGQSMSATSRLPFGLFFAPAIWLCWLLETTRLSIIA